MSAYLFLLRQSFLIYGIGMGFAVMAFLGEHISQACLTKWRARKKKVLPKSFLPSADYEVQGDPKVLTHF
jgi:hypothetical protein